MNIKTSLLKKYIADCICNQIEDFEIDEDMVLKKSEKILEEILIIKNSEYSDFEKVEEIVKVFEKNNIDCGSCHNF